MSNLATTRRRVLAGMAGVVATTGAAAVGDVSDAHVLALAEQHNRAFYEERKAWREWCAAIEKHMPPGSLEILQAWQRYA